MTSSSDTILGRVRQLQRAVRMVWESGRGWTAASVALLVVQGVLPLASLYLTKLLVDRVTTRLQPSEQAFGHVLWIVAGLAGVALLTMLCGSLAALVSEVLGLSAADHVQSSIHAKSVEADLAYYESSQFYDSLHRAQQQGSYRPIRIVTGLLQMGQSGVSLLALIGLLVALHPIIAAVLLLAAIPGTLARLRYSGKLYAWQRACTASERKAGYLQWVLTSEAHAKEVRLFDLGALLIGRWRDVRSALRVERLRLAVGRTSTELASQVVGTIAIFGALAYIAHQTLRGAITPGDLVMYYQAFQRGQGYLREVLGSVSGLYEDSLFLTSLYEFLDLPPRVCEAKPARPVPAPIRRGIEFHHVSFGYADDTRLVLDDVTFAIGPGEHVALVGENGAGKTTLVKLLCRLYDPTGGRITIDGVDLRDCAISDLRRQITAVFQDAARYQFTARENIRLGDVTLAPEDGRVVEAACAAGADGVVRQLPHGYETQLGKWFQDGHELSIGEWQKMALARAFARDAPIVVLDEPTSALDASAEHEVLQKFQRLAAGRTTILISHRLSSARLADRICVLAGGRIVEMGSHDELMSRGGEYARLFTLQAGNYR